MTTDLTVSILSAVVTVMHPSNAHRPMWKIRFYTVVANTLD